MPLAPFQDGPAVLDPEGQVLEDQGGRNPVLVSDVAGIGVVLRSIAMHCGKYFQLAGVAREVCWAPGI